MFSSAGLQHRLARPPTLPFGLVWSGPVSKLTRTKGWGHVTIILLVLGSPAGPTAVKATD